VFVAINTLDIGAAYRLSGISLSGCKDAVEKTLPSMFWKKLVHVVSAQLLTEDAICPAALQLTEANAGW